MSTSPRRIHVGEHLTFLFENHDTIRYQVQEMMRVEQIVREASPVKTIGFWRVLTYHGSSDPTGL